MKIPQKVFDYFDKNKNARYYEGYVMTNAGFILTPEYFKEQELLELKHLRDKKGFQNCNCILKCIYCEKKCLCNGMQCKDNQV